MRAKIKSIYTKKKNNSGVPFQKFVVEDELNEIHTITCWDDEHIDKLIGLKINDEVEVYFTETKKENFENKFLTAIKKITMIDSKKKEIYHKVYSQLSYAHKMKLEEDMFCQLMESLARRSIQTPTVWLRATS